ncbi:MAG: OmpH family outer membrane protein [Deltaproteobacteria bacterium]|nr:OmpH family outer membrane protein [Deltaproteobacteria bacterium]
MRQFRAIFVMAAVALAIVLLCPLQRAWAQQGQVGVFNLQKVMADSKKGKDAAKKLETKAEGYKKTLEAKAKDIEKKMQDLDKARATLSEEAFEKRRGDLAKEYNSYLEEQQKAAADMQKAEADTMRPLLERVGTVVENLAKERGFQVVLEAREGGLFYFVDVADITADVTKGLDR